MSNRGWIEPIVERVVGQVLESHTTQLRGEIVRQVMEEVAAQPETATPASTSGTADLARAVAEIQLGASQKEILRALLDSSSRYAARVALFVVKGSHATGWQGRGFENCDALKDFALDCNAQAVLRTIADRVAVSAPAAEFDARFVEMFGSPASGEPRLFPLILKNKVAALVYADGGNDGVSLDAGSLEVLVLSTNAWLEVNALRKQAHKDPSAVPGNGHEVSTPQPPPAFNDPFAAHSPAFAMAAAASAEGQTTVAVASPEAAPVVADAPSEVIEEPQTASAEMQSAAAPAIATEPLSMGHVQSEATPEMASAASAATSVSTEEQEVHRKAQRFARLLVDEIKLYNQAKVSEGRKNKDLYDRLKDTIEKSRTTYQRRYGNTVAASGDYFQHELIRSLAEDDRSTMGPNFRA
jgi:hypothetical protein